MFGLRGGWCGINLAIVRDGTQVIDGATRLCLDEGTNLENLAGISMLGGEVGP